MRSANSRKGQTSITHLMNFSLPPRPQYQPPYRSNTRRYATWGLGSGYHAMDKARYVHANYRFIVNPNRSYYAQAANADVHLDWDSVLQVLVSAQTQAASCPICLSSPVAPRMARCGHIFCLPCLIRYMHSTDDANKNSGTGKKARWQKCPICWDTVYASETRPVRWFSGQESDLPVEGGDVVLRLVKREPGSTLALPRDGAESLGPGEDIPWYHAAEIADYARIMKGGEDYMMSQYDVEIEDLHRQEHEDELFFGDDTTCFRKAVSTIADAKEKVKGIGNPPDVSTKPPAKKSSKEPIVFEDGAPAMYALQHEAKAGKSSSADSIVSRGLDSVNSAGEASTQGPPDVTDNLSEAVGNIDLGPTASDKAKQKDPGTTTVTERPKEPQAPHSSDHPFYFYQALPQFYLSSLDIRILRAAFGDYSQFPATVLPRVERISSGHVIDDELRKRAKYLGHLPQGCEVNFLECDWRDVVAPEVLDQFKEETGRRRKRNIEKEIREEKDRVRAEREEEKRWGAVHRKGSSFGASSDNPSFSNDDFQPLTPLGPASEDPSIYDIASSSASPPRPQSHFGALNPSSSPPGPRTVWGTAAVPPVSPSLEPQGNSNDGWREGWEEELLAQQESEQIAQSMSNGNNASSGGGKKKKNKKITLMSTSIQRGA